MRRHALYMVALGLLMAGCRPGAIAQPYGDVPAAVLSPPTPPIATVAGLAEPPAEPGSVPAAEPLEPAAASPTESSTELSVEATAAPTITPAPAVLAPPPPPTATSAPDDQGRFTIGAAPGVPAEFVGAVQASLAADFAWVDYQPGEDEPDVLLAVGNGAPLAEWVYVVAAPFATVADDRSYAAVQAGWQAGTDDLGRLLLDPETVAALTTVLGPSPAEIIGDDLVGHLWAARPAWTIVPFDRLEPRLKALSLDGQSTLAAEFGSDGYPLSVVIGATGSETALNEFLAGWHGPTTNRDPARLTRVAMTGVTALVRATAFGMEQRGMLWPGEEVAPVLQGADIAHISNEVSFTPDCPYPNPIGGTSFCSHDRYFELLQHLGTDIVELTGNHLNDYGRDNLRHSLALYESAGMDWFGGGYDLADASRAAIIEHNGNHIAFVGCNPVGPANDWATVDAAGSRPCGPDLAEQIRQLSSEGAIVIATLQYQEYYQYPAPAQQQADFAELAAAGASAVSGSQGHHAMGFSFDHGAFIHYGLGNLFFDQMDMIGTRQTFVDTYVLYDGRLISVDLWTGLIEQWARPRLMTPEERADLLLSTFQASGW